MPVFNIHTTNFQTVIAKYLSIQTDADGCSILVFTQDSKQNGHRSLFYMVQSYPKKGATTKKSFKSETENSRPGI